MRYPRNHRANTRDTLLRESAALAKREGFAASGVDALARAAGVTSGAFYKHFGGKDALLSAICEAELDATRARFAAIEPGATEQVLRAVDMYLSLAHVQNPAMGCALPALSAEIGRAPEQTRLAFERAFEELIAVIAEKVGAKAVGSALVTQCVGAVTLARALATEGAQRELLQAARRAARAILGAG
ncbi:MAG: TetR/AcrR family transcriptional regulator [Polyangiaceae bacterium]|nr:TetR/AcrR family transcriptional regulator [Polyangiaceae bacterium]